MWKESNNHIFNSKERFAAVFTDLIVAKVRPWVSLSKWSNFLKLCSAYKLFGRLNLTGGNVEGFIRVAWKPPQPEFSKLSIDMGAVGVPIGDQGSFV